METENIPKFNTEKVQDAWDMYKKLPKEDIPVSKIYDEFNKAVQELTNVKNGEVDYQDSARKIPMKWEKDTMEAEDLFNLEIFIPLNGEDVSVLNEWRQNGHKIKVRDVLEGIEKARKEGKTVSKDSWMSPIYNFDEKEFESRLKNKEIFPPMLFFVKAFGKDKSWGLLSTGNILNGNHRILEMCEYLRRNPEKKKDFRMDVLKGKANMFTYMAMLAWQFVRPEKEKLKQFYKEYIKREENIKRIPRENWIKFSERIDLLLERLNFLEGRT